MLLHNDRNSDRFSDEFSNQISRKFRTMRFIPIGISSFILLMIGAFGPSSIAAPPPPSTFLLSQTPAEQLDLDPDIIEQSPVLQRWLQEIPDIQSDIRNDPSFRTRLRLVYLNFPSSDRASGLGIVLEDLFIDSTRLTLNADYQTAFTADRESYGANLRYYVLPLGDRINIAPLVGYRSVETENDSTDGIDLGIRFLLIPSRTAAADIAFTQTWVIPANNQTVSLSTLTFAYALTDQLRLATDLQLQHTDDTTDSRVGIGMEWMF